MSSPRQIGYNPGRRHFFQRIETIRTETVFTAIRDINEVLSLSTEPQNLLNMALDSIARTFQVECCWIQITDSGKRPPTPVVRRGFTREMQTELSAKDPKQGLNKHIIGTGQKIVIPDLSQNGRYGLASFRRAGYRWLIAVPLLTYRVHGVLGIASRRKKRLQKDTAELTMAVAGLIGAALNRAVLARDTAPADNRPSKQEKAGAEDQCTAGPAGPEKPPPATGDGFRRHARKMEDFRKAHP